MKNPLVHLFLSSKLLIKFVKSAVSIALLCVFFNNTIHGQCNVNLSLGNNGSPCLGTDTLILSGGALATQIVWQNNGTTVGTAVSTLTNSAGMTVAGDSAGAFGTTNRLFTQPFCVIVDPSGNMYISDKSNNRIIKWVLGAKSGITIAGDSTGIAGNAPNLLNGPADIFLDSLNNLYIADENNNRIQKWSPGATSGTTVAGDPNGSSGTTPDLLNEPIGIYVDRTGNVYVSELGNNRVQKWPPAASSGTTVAGDPACTSGIGGNKLNQPAGIWLDGTGNVYVADANNNRIQKWAPGASRGYTVAGDSMGTVGNSGRLIWYPLGVYVDANDTMYVDDTDGNRIQKWVPGAARGYTVAGDSLGGIGISARKLHFPSGVFVAGRDIFIADFSNNRIQMWGPTIATTFVPTTPGDYTAIITTASGCVDTSNVSVVLPVAAPSATISASALSVCSYALDTFTAHITSGGSSPTYQWYLNAIPASTDSIYITTGLHDGDSLSLIVTSSSPCVTSSTALSNVIYITVPVSVTPSVTISSDQSSICSFGADTFTASITNGGSTPSYQWHRNGATVSNDSVYSASGFANNDSVWLIITNTQQCTTSPTAMSNIISVSVTQAVTPSVSISGSATTVCAATTDTFSATVSHGGSPSYQWYLNGTPVSTASTYITGGLHNSDSVWVIISSTATCAMPATTKSNVIDIYVPPTVTPTVTAHASAIYICSNSIDTFSATITNGGATPFYEWYRNGIAVSASSIYITTGLGNHDSVWVVITGDAPCTVNPVAISQKIYLSYGFTVTPSLTLSAHGLDTSCINMIDTIIPIPVNGGPTPQYQWQKNGANVSNAPTYIFSPQNGDIIKCIMTSDAACASPTVVTSMAATYTVYPIPIATIGVSGRYTGICPGDTVTLSGTGGSSYIWSTGDSTSSIHATTSGSYTVTAFNPSGCSAASAPIAVSFATVVAPTISQSGNTLTSSPASFYQWLRNGSDMTNATQQHILSLHGGDYQVAIIDGNGCKSISAIFPIIAAGINDLNSEIAVNLYPNPNTGSFTLELADGMPRTITISDGLGRKIIETIQASREQQYDIGSFADGLYYLQITEGDLMKTIKFSVIR